jgi:hypothetical protein
MKRAALLALALPLLAVTACGSAPARVAVTAAPAVTAPLATSLVTNQGSWAIVVMGGSAASEDNFWELFVQPAGASRWSLVTPPGVADNGGIVAAGSPASLLAGFLPSQDLAFSPLADSTSTGKSWTPGLLDAPLANAPDALSTLPGSTAPGSTAPAGRVLALLANQAIEAGSATGPWSELTTLKALAASAAGRECGLVKVTTISFWTNGSPIAAGECARPGVAGVFRDTDGTWEAAGPALPAAYAGDLVQVLRLNGETALLRAGPDLLVAWYAGTQWRLSPPIADAGQLTASGFGVNRVTWVLAGRRATAVAGPGAPLLVLPEVPAGTAVLVPSPGTAGPGYAKAGYEALAVSGSRLTVWRLEGNTWTKVQVINVPIQYGSSS